jgi:hypothetical protein
MQCARFQRLPRMRVQCFIVRSTPTGPFRRTLIDSLESLNLSADPLVHQVVQRWQRINGQYCIVGEAPVPLEFDAPDWEPPGEEEFDRRLPDGDGWDAS